MSRLSAESLDCKVSTPSDAKAQSSLVELISSTRARSASPNFNPINPAANNFLQVLAAPIQINKRLNLKIRPRRAKHPTGPLNNIQIPTTKLFQTDLPERLFKSTNNLRPNTDKPTFEFILSPQLSSRQRTSPINRLQESKSHDKWLNVSPSREQFSFRPCISPLARNIVSTANLQTRLYDDAIRRRRERASSPEESTKAFYTRYRDARILELKKDLEISWESYTTDNKISYDIYYKILHKMFIIDHRNSTMIPSSWQWLKDKVSHVTFEVLLALLKCLLNLGGEFEKYKSDLKQKYSKLVRKRISQVKVNLPDSSNPVLGPQLVHQASIQNKMKLFYSVNYSNKKPIQILGSERKSEECIFSYKRFL
jgi:hypothetical protein